MAEKLELHDLDRAAVPWWQLAAAFGDPDAQDYVQLIHWDSDQKIREVGLDDRGGGCPDLLFGSLVSGLPPELFSWTGQ